jgi:hypothetical protein
VAAGRDEKPFIVFECFKPGLDVGGAVVKFGVINSSLSAKIGASEFCNELLFAVLFAGKRPVIVLAVESI